MGILFFVFNDLGEFLCSKLGVVGFRGPSSGVPEIRTLVFWVERVSPFMESDKLLWDVGWGANFSHRLMLQFRAQGGLGLGILGRGFSRLRC